MRKVTGRVSARGLIVRCRLAQAMLARNKISIGSSDRWEALAPCSRWVHEAGSQDSTLSPYIRTKAALILTKLIQINWLGFQMILKVLRKWTLTNSDQPTSPSTPKKATYSGTRSSNSQTPISGPLVHIKWLAEVWNIRDIIIIWLLTTVYRKIRIWRVISTSQTKNKW